MNRQMICSCRWFISLVIFNLITLGLALPLWGAPDTVVVPAPTGPYRVGSLSLRLVDATRDDPMAAKGGKRELLVRFWYPAVLLLECVPAEYSSPKVWRHLAALTGAPPLAVKTNSCWQAPAARGAHPAVIASHGYTGMLTDYTFIFEDLASRGYIVASVAHTYETTAVEFPDGRLIPSTFGSHLIPDSLQTDLQSLVLARSVRVRDLEFVLRQLQELNSATGGPFYQRFDLARIGVLGHSLGGEVALTSLEQQPSLKAGALLDGVVSELSAGGTDKPILILAAGRQDWEETECRLWRNLRGPRMAVNLVGAEHLTPSDAIWLGAYVPALSVETEGNSPEQTIAAVRQYLSAFFDTHLAARPGGTPLGTKPRRPSVVVTTGKQSLCEQP